MPPKFKITLFLSASGLEVSVLETGEATSAGMVFAGTEFLGVVVAGAGLAGVVGEIGLELLRLGAGEVVGPVVVFFAPGFVGAGFILGFCADKLIVLKISKLMEIIFIWVTIGGRI
jgi:hypothetical protein